ncbi:helix-turn-helix domain-containing protein [Larkinella bovis]|uniref:Helix-turn-helix domain-containing protein n=1 Tax=Larkinella bovis TaxID=683041 RepID=A0ABW0I3E6_9BACT
MDTFFAANLKFLRKRKGVSQEQIAVLIDKKNSAIGSYENGISYPPVENLVTLADYFEVSLDELLLTNLSINYGEGQPDVRVNSNIKQKGKGAKHTASVVTGYGNPMNSSECEKLLQAKDDIIAAQQETINLYKKMLAEK